MAVIHFFMLILHFCFVVTDFEYSLFINCIFLFHAKRYQNNSSISCLPAQGNVVNSQDHLDGLGGQLDGAGADKKGLHDTLTTFSSVASNLTTHDTNASTLDADTDICLAVGVS